MTVALCLKQKYRKLTDQEENRSQIEQIIWFAISLCKKDYSSIPEFSNDDMS